MLKAASFWDEEIYIDRDNSIAIIESLLALTVINGLARRDYGAGFLETLSGNTNSLDLVSNYNASDMTSQDATCEN